MSKARTGSWTYLYFSVEFSRSYDYIFQAFSKVGSNWIIALLLSFIKRFNCTLMRSEIRSNKTLKNPQRFLQNILFFMLIKNAEKNVQVGITCRLPSTVCSSSQYCFCFQQFVQCLHSRTRQGCACKDRKNAKVTELLDV